MQLYAGYTLTPINPEGTLTVDTEKALIQLLMKILSAILALLVKFVTKTMRVCRREKNSSGLR